jgi:hypothetical protein
VRASGSANDVLDAVSSRAFREHGLALGAPGDLSWVVVDPRRHPLEVWERQPWHTYAGTARALGAAVVTNGPYMGRMGRAGVAMRLTAGSTAGALLGRLAGRDAGAAALGAGLGAAAGWRAALSNWTPCGIVRSASAGIDDQRDFGAEGATHAWIGQGNRRFDDCAIGLGHPPPELGETMGGLIPLVIDGLPIAVEPGAPGYQADAARVQAKAPIVSWALLPVADAGAATDGVLLVATVRSRDAGATLAARLVALGATSAVATDTSGCAMLRAEHRFLAGPPLPHRQSIQRYGLCCR